MPRVGEYEMGKTIGSGAYSKVKLCTHVPTSKECVAKIVPKTNQHVETEIRVEIGVLRKLKHPNIVQLIEILESPRYYYIILEAVMGGDLCDMIIQCKTGIPENEARSYFVQILKGLQACHASGVAHRDLKPENLLLTTGRVIKISDFGLSRLHDESIGSAIPTELAHTLTGTLAYIAPEVLKGTYDAFKADAWSLGCILYVMLTCRFPFGSVNDLDVADKIKTGTMVPLPDSVSAESRDLVSKLICVNPNQRWTLEQAAAHPWAMADSSQGLAGLPKMDPVVVKESEVGNFAEVNDPSSPAMSPTFKRPKRPTF